MHYLSGGLFQQNKFPVKLVSPKSVLSLATCVLLFSRCVCPCPLSRHLHHIHILYAEAVARKCSSKKMFLKISQISQVNACVGVSF